MFTIKELEDKWIDYESACLLTIKQLLTDCKEVIFDSDDLSDCPSCISDADGVLVDVLIKCIYLQNDRIMVEYEDREDPFYCTNEELKYLIDVDYLEIISLIKKNLKWQD